MAKEEKTLEQQYRELSRSAWWLGVTMLVVGPVILTVGGAFIVAGAMGALHWVYIILGVVDIALGGVMCFQGHDFRKNVSRDHLKQAENMKELEW